MGSRKALAPTLILCLILFGKGYAVEFSDLVGLGQFEKAREECSSLEGDERTQAYLELIKACERAAAWKEAGLCLAGMVEDASDGDSSNVAKEALSATERIGRTTMGSGDYNAAEEFYIAAGQQAFGYLALAELFRLKRDEKTANEYHTRLGDHLVSEGNFVDAANQHAKAGNFGKAYVLLGTMADYLAKKEKEVSARVANPTPSDSPGDIRRDEKEAANIRLALVLYNTLADSMLAKSDSIKAIRVEAAIAKRKALESAQSDKEEEILEFFVVEDKPVMKTKTDPAYPEEAKLKKLSGKVFLRFVVGRDGNVSRVSLLRGHPVLGQAAMEAVKDWTFEPARQGGTPVSVWMSQAVSVEPQ